MSGCPHQILHLCAFDSSPVCNQTLTGEEFGVFKMLVFRCLRNVANMPCLSPGKVPDKKAGRAGKSGRGIKKSRFRKRERSSGRKREWAGKCTLAGNRTRIDGLGNRSSIH